MRNWWNSLGIGSKLNIPIQVMLVVVLSFAHFWVMGNIKYNMLADAQRRATVSADGVINGMNMLMLTGTISDPENRRLFITKMGASEDVKELRIIRAKQVQDQFCPGLPRMNWITRQSRPNRLSSCLAKTMVLQHCAP